MILSKALAQVENVEHGFTTRQDSPATIAELERQCLLLQQVHGDTLVWIADEQVTDPAAVADIQGDAIGTANTDITVGVRTADCVPLLLVALNNRRKATHIMAVHAGWRGTAAKIAEKALRQLSEQTQTDNPDAPNSVLAVIGPCISAAKFEVGPDVAEAFPWLQLSPFRHEGDRPKYYFDLPGENSRQLETAAAELGLALEMDNLSRCTLSEPEIFPSYRRDGAGRGERIIAFLTLRKAK